MVGEVSSRYSHGRTYSSQFTTSTYPGGLPRDFAHQHDNVSSLPFLSAIRRRKYYLISSAVLFSVAFCFLRTFTTASLNKVASIYAQPHLVGDTSSNQASTMAVQTTIYVTKTVYFPGPTQAATVQTHYAPILTYQEAIVFVLIMWSRSSAIEGALLIKVCASFVTAFYTSHLSSAMQ